VSFENRALESEMKQWLLMATVLDLEEIMARL
jgi:hypothetical protein